MADARLTDKKIVCLGGGVGTVNMLRGLKAYTTNITTIISMADNGGSSGRLRRLYDVLPSGDLVSCMSAMSMQADVTQKLLTYRFPGERYGDDHELGGQKLGNLIMVALEEVTGSFEKAIQTFQALFDVKGAFVPATQTHVDISAFTTEGKEIFGEETIDLGKYEGKRVLERIVLHPSDAVASPGAVESIMDADTILCGPGDLYTNLLPVLVVDGIKKALLESTAKKIFIVNVANKPFETLGYYVEDYMSAIIRHLGSFPFGIVLTNSNISVPIPSQYHYTYVTQKKEATSKEVTIVSEDLIDETFPLYHGSEKLAKTLVQYI